MLATQTTLVLIGSLQGFHGHITHGQTLLQATASRENQGKVKVIFLKQWHNILNYKI